MLRLYHSRLDSPRRSSALHHGWYRGGGTRRMNRRSRMQQAIVLLRYVACRSEQPTVIVGDPADRMCDKEMCPRCLFHPPRTHRHRLFIVHRVATCRYPASGLNRPPMTSRGLVGASSASERSGYGLHGVLYTAMIIPVPVKHASHPPADAASIIIVERRSMAFPSPFWMVVSTFVAPRRAEPAG